MIEMVIELVFDLRAQLGVSELVHRTVCYITRLKGYGTQGQCFGMSDLKKAGKDNFIR
jgi:hypothetical protein